MTAGRMGVIAKPATAAPPTISFLQSASDASDGTSYTFSSQNLGTAAAARVIVVAVASRKLGSSIPSRAVTVAGISATSAVGSVRNDNHVATADLFAVAVPTGTTGNVVVTFGNSMLRCCIALWRCTNIPIAPSSTGTDSNFDNTDVTLSATVTVPTSGFLIAAGSISYSPALSTDWTDATERCDEFSEATALAGADSTATGSRTPILTIGSRPMTFENSFAVAAWGPA